MKDTQHNRYREEEQLEEKETTKTEEDIEAKDDDTVNPLAEELQKTTNAYMRVLADFENFKKRTQEERIKERRYQYFSLFEQLINVVDIFDKAINIKTEDDKIKNFLLGFTMINKNFKQILENEGVKKIEALDQTFNPNYHHALETSWDENIEENKIVEEMQTGYMYKDRILRPSLVRVNLKKKGSKKDE